MEWIILYSCLSRTLKINEMITQCHSTQKVMKLQRKCVFINEETCFVWTLKILSLEFPKKKKRIYASQIVVYTICRSRVLKYFFILKFCQKIHQLLHTTLMEVILGWSLKITSSWHYLFGYDICSLQFMPCDLQLEGRQYFSRYSPLPCPKML